MDLEALFTILEGVPRAGPGSDAATREALLRLPKLPPDAKVADFGCGPGRQTLVLAKHLNTQIVAVDLHNPFLERLAKAAAAAGLSDKITPCQADFGNLSFEPHSLDLIWAEGAIYFLGFADGLRRWEPFLKETGFLVATHLTWLTEFPPPEADAYWADEFPGMTSVKGNQQSAAQAGFEVFDHFVMRPQDWLADYYQPLIRRIETLRPHADYELAAMLEDFLEEIEIFKKYHEAFGYVFYFMKKA